jgi:CBS domain-containing protein
MCGQNDNAYSKNTEGDIMPCRDAMITDVITARADQTVADAVALFEKNKITSVPIIDDENKVIGVFSFTHLLENILPMSLAVGNGFNGPLARLKHMEISLDSLSEAKPWVAKRLILELPKKLQGTMIQSPAMVRPDTPLREGIRKLVKYGSPLVVVKDDSNTLEGLITYHKTLLALNNLVAKTVMQPS